MRRSKKTRYVISKYFFFFVDFLFTLAKTLKIRILYLKMDVKKFGFQMHGNQEKFVTHKCEVLTY